jgi:hypothetical protein
MTASNEEMTLLLRSKYVRFDHEVEISVPEVPRRKRSIHVGRHHRSY